MATKHDEINKYKKMKAIEKILSKASGIAHVEADEYITAKVDIAMQPENFLLLPKILESENIDKEKIKIWDPGKFVVILDHRVPPATINQAENQKISREFSEKIGVKYFYDVSSGTCHQVMIENGHVLPGTLVVGTDSHVSTYGALNCASTAIGPSEMAYVLATGELWFKVPETILFELTGTLSEFITSKDIILSIAGKYGDNFAEYKAIEWLGNGVDQLSVESRMTISNMSTELQAKFNIFKVDDETIDYLKNYTDKTFIPVESDPDEIYPEHYTLDISHIEPQVALPHHVGNTKDVSEIGNIFIDQAVIGSCCDGRLEDLEAAAKIMKGNKVHKGVRLYIAPASWRVYRQALKKGIIETLADSGAIIGIPSCGFCSGGIGLLAGGERCITSAPRNFKGRMGSPEAEIYLASTATVAFSALKGKIADPREAL